MAEEKKIFPNELTDEKLLTFKPPELKDPSVVFFFWAVIMNYHVGVHTFIRFMGS